MELQINQGLGSALRTSLQSDKSNILNNMIRDLYGNNRTLRVGLNCWGDNFVDESGLDVANSDSFYDAESKQYTRFAIKGVSFEVITSTVDELGSVSVYKDQIAQGFKVPSTLSDFQGFQMYLLKNGTPGDVEFRKETDSAAEPSGTLADAAASKTFTEASITGPGWFGGVFDSPYTLTAGVQYHALLKLSGDPGNGNFYTSHGSDADEYADGIAQVNLTGPGWSASALQEYAFRILRTPPVTAIYRSLKPPTLPVDVPKIIRVVAWADPDLDDMSIKVSRNDGGNFSEALEMLPMGFECNTYKSFHGFASVDDQPLGTAPVVEVGISGALESEKLKAIGLYYG